MPEVNETKTWTLCRNCERYLMTKPFGRFERIGAKDLCDDDAAFIVEAVNSHAALLRVKEAAEKLQDADHYNHVDTRMSPAVCTALTELFAALAAAGEGGGE